MADLDLGDVRYRTGVERRAVADARSHITEATPIALVGVDRLDTSVQIIDLLVAELERTRRDRNLAERDAPLRSVQGGDPVTVQFDLPDLSWMDDAACIGVDADLFFPVRGESTTEAKEVCRGCVVREQCLDLALANGEKFGIWGGLSERERRPLRRARRLTKTDEPIPNNVLQLRRRRTWR